MWPHYIYPKIFPKKNSLTTYVATVNISRKFSPKKKSKFFPKKNFQISYYKWFWIISVEMIYWNIHREICCICQFFGMSHICTYTHMYTHNASMAFYRVLMMYIIEYHHQRFWTLMPHDFSWWASSEKVACLSSSIFPRGIKLKSL